MRALWLSFAVGLLLAAAPDARAQLRRAQPGQGASPLSIIGPRPQAVRVGDVARLQITFVGEGRVELEAPKKNKDLQIQVQGPGRTQILENINGRRSFRVESRWEIQMRPMRAGKFVLGPYRVRYKGKVYTSQRAELVAVEDVADRDAAFFEVRIEPERVYRQQRFAVVFRVGLVPDRVERLRRVAMDKRVYGLLIAAPWWDEFPAGRPGAEADWRTAREAVIPINGNLRVAKDLGTVKRDGRHYRVFELRRYFLPTKSGKFALQVPSMTYTWVTRYVQDLFGSLSPAETRNGFARPADTPVVEIRDLPSAGRPSAFANLVGRIELRAEVDKPRVKVGESFVFTLSLSGEADWELIEAPELRGFDGFHVYGKKVERRKNGVDVRYDISALEDRPTQLPIVELAHFDPSIAPNGAYRVAKSKPVPIEIEALPKGKGLDALPKSRETLTAGVDDIWDRMALQGSVPASLELSPALAWGGLIAPLLLFCLAFLIVRRLQWRAANPRLVASRQALARFEGSIAQEGALRALTSFVAERLGWDRGETVGEDLAQRLEGEGVGSELARRVEHCVQRLLASRYAGGDEAQLSEEARSVARDLDREARR